MDNKNVTTDSDNRSGLSRLEDLLVWLIVISMLLGLPFILFFLSQLLWAAIIALFSSESRFDKDPIVQFFATILITAVSYGFYWLKRKYTKLFGALEILFAIFLCVMAMNYTLGKGKLDNVSLNIIVIVRICAFGSALFCFAKGFENISKTNK